MYIGSIISRKLCGFTNPREPLTEQSLDWIPQNTRKLKMAALEFVGLKKLKVWQAIIKQGNYCSVVLPQQIQERQLFF